MADGLNGVMKEIPMRQVYQNKNNSDEKLLLDDLVNIDNYLPLNGNKKQELSIISDLKAPQKKISSVFFYDKKGSELFEQITKLPEYYLTRTEIPLLKKASRKIKEELRNIDIIEFGSGDCKKISILLENVSDENINTICYVPFDVSISAVENSSKILLDKYPGIRIHGIVADFINQLNILPKETKKLFCFLGSTIGNFRLEKAQQFLINLSEIMHTGDLFLLGFDMVKNKDVLNNAYNDRKKVTDEFNKNILNVINKLIDTDFQPDFFDHVAFYNEDFSRIEMHLKAKKDMKISSPNFSSKIYIKKGETIHTENSYKFTDENIRTLTYNAGLDIIEILKDENKWFSLVLLTKN
jgi:L-histidine N-alpha-methyltransferase